MPGFKLTPDRYPTITRQTKKNNAPRCTRFCNFMPLHMGCKDLNPNILAMLIFSINLQKGWWMYVYTCIIILLTIYWNKKYTHTGIYMKIEFERDDFFLFHYKSICNLMPLFQVEVCLLVLDGETKKITERKKHKRAKKLRKKNTIENDPKYIEMVGKNKDHLGF